MTLLLLLRLSSSIFLSTISRHHHHLHKSSSLLFLSQRQQQQQRHSFPSSSSSSSALLIMPHDLHHHPWASSINRQYSSHSHNLKPKIVVIMGPTGSGKSRLSIHLATRFFPTSEIINSDKIQVYKGLDITTNKIPIHQQLGVPHHLLGHFCPSHSRPEFSPSDFRDAAASAISVISNRRNLPLLVGGSNSFIYALIADHHHDPNTDIFNLDQQRQQQEQSPIDSAQRYDCCFIRMDVSFPVLNWYLVKRVDEMMGRGMLEELLEFFKSKGFVGEEEAAVGLRKAIGVAELEEYFRDPGRKRRALEEGIGKIKRNTCELARRQVDKTRRLRDGAGWKMHRVDGTEALRAMIAAGEGRCSGEEATEIWESQVLEPSVKIVKQFLDE